jgi:sarcosine oxidase subunit delta
MKIMPCPLNGPRNISEFVCLGEVKQVPPPVAPAEAWADFVFVERNPAGVVQEWWCHVATNYIFIAERDTLSDTILKTYPPDRRPAAGADTSNSSAPAS